MNIHLSSYNLSSLYSVLLAWVPLLGIYRLLPGISIGETILMFFTLLTFILNRKNNKFSYSIAEIILFIFLLYCFLTTTFVFIFNESFEFFWLNRLVRFIFYGICVLFTSKVLFNEKDFFKSFNAAATVIFLGIIFQYIVYYVNGTYITLYDVLLPVTNEVLASIDYQRIFSYGVFRPSSFFTEPSHIAQYLVIVLIYDLFNNFNINNKKSLLQVVLICTTILLSKSLWGYFLLILLFSILFFINLTKSHKASWFLIVPLAVIIVSISFFSSSFFTETFSRINLFDLGSSQAFSGRFGKYDLVNTENIITFIFGSGFGIGIGDIVAYPNSVLFILIGEGMFGLSILGVLYFAFIYNNSVVWKRILSSVMYMLMFGSTILFSPSMVLVFSSLFKQDTPKDSPNA